MNEKQLAQEKAFEQCHWANPLETVVRSAADDASAVWEEKVKRLQIIVKIANGQLAGNFAPITAFAAVADDPALLAEAIEALELDHEHDWGPWEESAVSDDRVRACSCGAFQYD